MGVEGLVLVCFDVEEVCAADGEAAVLVGELDHLLWNVGGVCDGDACGVAVFVWDHVAFLELAECGPFPGAVILVGDVLAFWRVVCSCHCVPLLFLICFWRVRVSRGPRVCIASFPARVFFPAV